MKKEQPLSLVQKKIDPAHAQEAISYIINVAGKCHGLTLQESQSFLKSLELVNAFIGQHQPQQPASA